MITHAQISKHIRKIPNGTIKANISKIKANAKCKQRKIYAKNTPVCKPPRIAILWDGENVSARYASEIVKHAESWGRVTLQRLYGPFSLLESQGFVQAVREHGFEEVVCNGLRAGKNSVDINLVVDAMEYAHADLADDFVLVSGDSDYGPLIRSLRKQGKVVHGVGGPNAAAALRKACDTWVCVNGSVISGDAQQEIATRQEIVNPRKKGNGSDPTELLLDAISRMKCDKDGWVDVSSFALSLRLIDPEFSPKKFGARNISTLLKRTKEFEVRQVNNHCDVRLKR